MTETYSGELSEDTKRSLLWIFDAAAGWQARTEEKGGRRARREQPAEGRRGHLPVLDIALRPRALVSSVDHLNAFRALVQDAHIVHPRATLTLLRAAPENAALAVWLLAPANGTSGS
jgi:hypothetical protein